MPRGTARPGATANPCEARRPRVPKRLSLRAAPGAHPGTPGWGSPGATPRRPPVAGVAQPTGWAASGPVRGCLLYTSPSPRD
eukprot:10426802-Alexandrium_andersonii.AAC.1